MVDVTEFWEQARRHAGIGRLSVLTGETSSSALAPPAWAFGRTASEADELLDLVLAGHKSATSSALADYAAEDEPLPAVGDLSIVVDGAGEPRALLRTTAVRVVPFAEVDADHADAEGEGEATLASWRAEHADLQGGDVVLERFRLLHPRPPR